MNLLKLTRAQRLTDAQRDLVDSDPELVAILVAWARRRGGDTYPAEELVHDSLVCAAARWDSSRSSWRTWATNQTRWAFARYARPRALDRSRKAKLLAFATANAPRVHGRALVVA